MGFARGAVVLVTGRGEVDCDAGGGCVCGGCCC